jgi:hypothetical protein
MSNVRPGVPKEIYTLLLLVAASIVAARILMAPGAFSANDRSRWATVRALVETGTYAIGAREQYADGTHRDSGIVTEGGWESIDVVMDPATGRFYSSKPALLPTLVAGEYWFLHHALDWSIVTRRLAVARTILLTINVVPFVLYLLVFGWLADRLGATLWGRLFVFTTAAFGTFVSGFLATLNNHTVAAMGVLFAVYQCLRIELDDDRRPWRFLLAGLFAGWAATNELPAAALAAGVVVWLWRLSPRQTIRLACPMMAVPVAAFLLTQYLATGSVLPTYAQKSWYEFAGSYWLAEKGIDRVGDHKLVYAANLLVGHTGILSLTPVLLLGWIGMARAAARGEGSGAERAAYRTLGWLTVVLTAVTFVFYVIRTQNYGGTVAGPRWFFWLTPLWLIAMIPEADRWAPDRRRFLAYGLLAISIVTASYTLSSPWRHSWLFTIFRAWGLISY